MAFCHKCGAKADDDAIICSNCGERLILDDIEQQATAMVQSQMNNIQTNETRSQMNSIQSNEPQPRKKKSRKFPIILAVIAVAIIVRIVIIGLIGDKIDYIATVKTFEFFDDMPYTFDQVFTKYIESPVWKVRKSGEDSAYVDISGTTKGEEIDLSVTIKVESDPDNPDGIVVILDSVTLNSDKYTGEDDVVEFISGMFSAYDQKYDTLSDYLDDSQSDLNYALNDGNSLQSNSNTTSNSNRIEIGETKSYNNNDSNLEVTLDYVEFVDEVQNELIGNYMYPEDGNVFLRAAITVKNVGTKAGQFLTAWNTIIYDNTYEFDHFSVEGNFIGIKPLSSPVAGALIFEVPIDVIESDKSLVLNINDMMIGEPIISYTIRPDSGMSGDNKLNTLDSNIADSNMPNSNTTSSTAPDKNIFFKGIPITTLFYQPAEDVINMLGWSANVDRDDDIRLYTTAGYVETAEISNISALTMNGTSLEKNRDGLVALLGEPSEEGNDSGYFVKYQFPSCSLTFELGEPDSVAWRISIYPTY